MSVVVKRYAIGLLEAIPESERKGVVDEYRELLEQLEKKNIYFILKNPEIDKAKKKLLIDSIFTFDTGKYLKNFLYLLLDKDRIGLLKDIFAHFYELYLQSCGVERIKIEVARPIDEGEKKLLQEKFRQLVGKDVELEVVLNPDLLAGLRVYYQDQVLDGSLQGKFKKIYQKIIEE